MARIHEILKGAVTHRVSDLHFSSGEAIWARIDGDLRAFTEAPLSNEQLETLLLEILSEAERTRLLEFKNLDKSYFVDGLGNFRVNLFYTRRGIGAVIRTLPSKIPSLADLGLPEVVQQLAELPKGLILVTGPTGSGKSTTLAAMIHHINSHFPYHILTAEDPVEFIHPSIRSLINQREIGHSCPTFADALKFALREDPDVILVGELRDLETISLAMTAAETGHLVFGTLHTRGAASTIDRVIESFPALQQPMIRTMLAESLQGVISQTLVKRASGKGRVAAYEIMVMNHAISNLIREGKTFQVTSAMQTGRKEGMVLMESHLKELVAAKEVTPEEAESVLGTLVRGNTPAKAPPPGATTPPLLKTPPVVPNVASAKAPAVSAAVPTPAAPAPVTAPAPARNAPPAFTPKATMPPGIPAASGGSKELNGAGIGESRGVVSVPSVPPVPPEAEAAAAPTPTLPDYSVPNPPSSSSAPDLISVSELLELNESGVELSDLTFDIPAVPDAEEISVPATVPPKPEPPAFKPVVGKEKPSPPARPPLPLKKTG
jgi:twitching motility protein PilT